MATNEKSVKNIKDIVYDLSNTDIFGPKAKADFITEEESLRNTVAGEGVKPSPHLDEIDRHSNQKTLGELKARRAAGPAVSREEEGDDASIPAVEAATDVFDQTKENKHDAALQNDVMYDKYMKFREDNAAAFEQESSSFAKEYGKTPTAEGFKNFIMDMGGAAELGATPSRAPKKTARGKAPTHLQGPTKSGKPRGTQMDEGAKQATSSFNKNVFPEGSTLDKQMEEIEKKKAGGVQNAQAEGTKNADPRQRSRDQARKAALQAYEGQPARDEENAYLASNMGLDTGDMSQGEINKSVNNQRRLTADEPLALAMDKLHAGKMPTGEERHRGYDSRIGGMGAKYTNEVDPNTGEYVLNKTDANENLLMKRRLHYMFRQARDSDPKQFMNEDGSTDHQAVQNWFAARGYFGDGMDIVHPKEKFEQVDGKNVYKENEANFLDAGVYDRLGMDGAKRFENRLERLASTKDALQTAAVDDIPMSDAVYVNRFRDAMSSGDLNEALSLATGHGDGLGASRVEDIMKRDVEVKKTALENKQEPSDKEPTQSEQIMGTSLDVLAAKLSSEGVFGPEPAFDDPRALQQWRRKQASRTKLQAFQEKNKRLATFADIMTDPDLIEIRDVISQSLIDPNVAGLQEPEGLKRVMATAWNSITGETDQAARQEIRKKNGDVLGQYVQDMMETLGYPIDAGEDSTAMQRSLRDHMINEFKMRNPDAVMDEDGTGVFSPYGEGDTPAEREAAEAREQADAALQAQQLKDLTANNEMLTNQNKGYLEDIQREQVITEGLTTKLNGIREEEQAEIDARSANEKAAEVLEKIQASGGKHRRGGVIPQYTPTMR